ncbi:acyl-ACP desaturase [Microtetraspora malaysiensis]|uniref:acyl-ACP desaturase n=1 Tax=Microtetraspora malaysiensis TaxID=161358 RepID=UPI003D89EB7C
MTGVLDFDELFYKHERVRWSPTRDLPPFSEIDRSKIDGDMVDGLVVLARTEFSSIPAILDLVRIFRHDADLTAWLSIWFAEEVRHHLLLRQWAEAAGRDPEGMVPELTRPELGDPPAIATLAVNVLGEVRTCRLYGAMAAACEEPVLAALLKKIAGDEGRHAQGFAHYARKLATADPDGAVPVLLRVGQLWCDPDSGLADANPAAENYQEAETAAAMAELHRRWVDPEREARAICSLFGDIAGLPISTPADFATLRKQARA